MGDEKVTETEHRDTEGNVTGTSTSSETQETNIMREAIEGPLSVITGDEVAKDTVVETEHRDTDGNVTGTSESRTEND